MGEQLFDLTITAVGEVRDVDGNLVSTEPVEAHLTVNAAQLTELGITPEGNPS